MFFLKIMMILKWKISLKAKRTGTCEYWFSFCLMDLMINGFFRATICGLKKVARPKKKKVLRQNFFVKLSPIELLDRFVGANLGEKIWRDTFLFFFLSRHFFQTSNCHLKTPCKFFLKIVWDSPPLFLWQPHKYLSPFPLSVVSTEQLKNTGIRCLRL